MLLSENIKGDYCYEQQCEAAETELKRCPGWCHVRYGVVGLCWKHDRVVRTARRLPLYASRTPGYYDALEVVGNEMRLRQFVRQGKIG